MEKKRQLIWDNRAANQLVKSLEWIAETSEYRAQQVEQAILQKIEIVLDHPERYPLDKYRFNNSGDFRAFETHSYRITYSYTDYQIRIHRIRHVKREPKTY